LVHLGLVYRLDTKDEVRVRETGKMEGLFVTVSQLTDSRMFSTLESWSGILVQQMLEKNA